MMRFIAILCLCIASMGQFVKAKQILLDGQPVDRLATALKNAKDGSIIELSAGLYQDGGVLKANFVTIQGQSGTHLQGFSAAGKGTLVIKGDSAEIINIECSGVKVKDKNGACVRLQGQNLTLRNVYFHDSQQGLLTGHSPGSVFIENSRFERLGRAGRAHAIYVGGGELYIHNSTFIASKDEGHEIKSRAEKTVISSSTIASLDGKDSRLVDVPNGGELSISNSTLQQGNNTSNWNLIGYGMEGIKHPTNTVSLTKNVFILDRQKGSRVFQHKGKLDRFDMKDNLVVGKYNDDNLDQSNIFFKSRAEAGLAPAPFLPKR